MSNTEAVEGQPAGEYVAAEVVAITPEKPQPPQPDVSDPAKLIRLGTMLQTLLTELQGTEPDAAGVKRLAQIHEEAIEELQKILSEELQDELLEFNTCCGSDTPSASEMRVAQAQLVGWIQGLLHGMQATAAAQAQMAQQQMMMMQAQAQQRALMAQQAGSGAGSDPAALPESGYL